MVTADVMPYKWGKLMGNLANAVGAATDGNDPRGALPTPFAPRRVELMQQAGLRAISLVSGTSNNTPSDTSDRG